MFDKDQTTVSGPGTVVGANVKLTGTLKDVNDITIHGVIDGEVISDRNVIISETASIKGPITANTIVVSGKVNGSITAQEKLEISPTGKVYGSIVAGDLIINSGAIFVGKSNTLKEKDETPVEKKSAKDVEKKEEKVEKEPKVEKIEKKNEPTYEVE